MTYLNLVDFSRDLRHWYFHAGGIYLSTEARGTYGKVQDTVATVLKDASEGRISDGHYEQGREAWSLIRTELKQDLLSRKRVFLP